MHILAIAAAIAAVCALQPIPNQGARHRGDLFSVALTDFHLRHNSPVIPDPYYGNAQGFNHVLDLIEDACDGLLAHVVQQLDTDI